MTAGTKAAATCVLIGALLCGCASRPSVPGSAQSGEASAAPRSARGNPPFYEVLGTRYYVLDSSEGYLERGVASWYGRKFHGSPTSSGERYDMYAMTAAHKTLPLPTWVEVTSLENGRRVVVRVNDRGPFARNRIIDLSYAAAQELDMVGPGTARVEVRALPASPGRPTAEPPRQARNDRERPRGGFSLISEAAAATLEPEERRRPPLLFIQVGAFGARQNAAELVARLHGGGFENAFVVTGVEDGLHRVRVGPFTDVTDYDRASDGLRRFGLADAHLVVDR